MAAVKRARRRHRQRQRTERIFPTRITLFQLSEPEIIRRYRLTSHAILQLLNEIRNNIEPPTRRSHSIPSVVKLLATLQILASGSFQTVIASAVGTYITAFTPNIHPGTRRIATAHWSIYTFPHYHSPNYRHQTGFISNCKLSERHWSH